MDPLFQVTILGCNAAIPSKERNTTSQLVQFAEKYFLLDCGEGALKQMVEMNIPFIRISRIFISHLHGDHVFGLIGLLTTMNLLGRTNPLYIYSPNGIKELIEIQLRICGQVELKFTLNIQEHDTEQTKIVFEDKDLVVSSIPLLHRVPTTGYLIQEKERAPKLNKQLLLDRELTLEQIKSLKRKEDLNIKGEVLPWKDFVIRLGSNRSYAFCTDTAYSPAICDLIFQSDLLYHESTYSNLDEPIAIQSLHSTSIQAAKIAQQSKCKYLLLGHLSSRYKDLNILLEEAKLFFPNSRLAEDKMSVQIHRDIVTF